MREVIEIMSFVEQLTAITLLIGFLFGVMFGVVGSASLASRLEDSDYSLTHAPPDPLCDGARVVHGVYTRGGSVSDAIRHSAHANDGRHGDNGGSGDQGQEPER
jgi:hypothetical protein